MGLPPFKLHAKHMPSSKPAPAPKTNTLSGTIITCFGEACWAGVLEDKDGNEHRFAGNGIGNLNDAVTFTGQWVNTEKWGEQFKVTNCQIVTDTSTRGVMGFLDQMPGIGPALARRIITAFGEKTFEIIQDNPGELTKVKGITDRMVKDIHEVYMEKLVKRDLIVFLKSLGVTDGKIGKILALYGMQAAKIIKNNPYRMIEDIDGFGFKTVDVIAIRAGIKPDSPERIRAGLIFALKEAEQEGHCYVNKDTLIAYACREILRVPVKNVTDELEYMHQNKLSITMVDGKRIYLGKLFHAETKVSYLLKERIAGETLFSNSTTERNNEE